jgi:hypothetical protein
MSEETTEDEWIDMALGPLPIAAILQCLGLKLLPGEVMFYAHAQRHTFEGRPERRVCLPHLKEAIATPSHIGQQPGYEADSVDLVYSCPDGLIILIAISMRIKRGLYPMKSTYPLKIGALRRRTEVGTTKAV